MKEHHRTDRLTLITIIFVIIIGIILITYRAPRLSFELNPDEMLSNLDNDEYVITKEQALQLISDPGVKFVDVRSKGEFTVSKIDNAINIPLVKILDEESIDLFEENEKQFVLYGNSHREANAAWMLLRQLDLKNIKVLLGGYDNYTSDSLSFPHFYAEMDDLIKAEFDLESEMEERGKLIMESDAAKVEIAKKSIKSTSRATVKKSTPAPVLPPPVEEEEEEEGC